MNEIGIMLYTDTNITKETIRDIGFCIKKELLTYIDNINYIDTYNITVFIDKKCNVRDELVEIASSFADLIMDVSINERLLEKSKDKESDRLEMVIDAMEDYVFDCRYPLILHIADILNIVPFDSFDNHLHQYLYYSTDHHVKSKIASHDVGHDKYYHNQPILTVFEYDDLYYELYINRYGYAEHVSNNDRLLDIKFHDKNSIDNLISQKSVLKHITTE